VLSFSMVVIEVGIVTFGEVSSCRRECQLREKKEGGENLALYTRKEGLCPSCFFWPLGLHLGLG
jgi:hypothetical protein